MSVDYSKQDFDIDDQFKDYILCKE